jgi:hypothetical protein
VVDWDMFFSEFFGFPCQYNFTVVLHAHIQGMNNMSVSGSVSETQCHPIEIYNGSHLCWRMARTERLSVQQATEADWLTRARDFKCEEQSKTWPCSYVPITLHGPPSQKTII